MTLMRDTMVDSATPAGGCQDCVRLTPGMISALGNKELARRMYRRHSAPTIAWAAYASRVRAPSGRGLLAPAGNVVIDAACGTGLSFPLIEERIGAEGRLIGVDLSDEMLAKARQKVTEAGWKNVTLIEGAADEATIPVEADAVFFHFAHDVMRTPAALENIFRHARPGASIVSAGGKRAP
jgi:SAM-dependent methyltransferase